ncbi:MAG: NAD(P)/FAD-dependent oxidoreductase, partial [Thermoguttaceae bacterium]
MSEKHRMVIVGGGFGGLYCAQSLRKTPVQVTLVDRRNFHLFQPLLYQVAAGELSPANIAAPLRAVLERHANVEVLMGEVCGFDLAGRRVLLTDGDIAYDTLIVAAGSETSYFGHGEWELTAPGLKTIEEATDIRHRVLVAFETAERQRNAAQVGRQLTFVVIGGGPTGVEMAGAVAEMAKHTLRGEFRWIDPARARIFLIEGGDRVLNAFPTSISDRATTQLEQLGVILRLKTLVTDVRPDGVTIRCGEQTEEIAAATLIWAAGVRASPLGKVLAGAAGVQPDRQGRVVVGPDLSLPGHAEVFVIGDLAHTVLSPNTEPLPGLAPVAMQEGRYVAKL